MYTKQSILKELLTNMLDTLNPEVEMAFDDYINSTSLRDKALIFFEDVTKFLESVADTAGIPDISDQVVSVEFIKKIKSDSIFPFFYQLALYHDLKNYDHKIETLEINLANSNDDKDFDEAIEFPLRAAYKPTLPEIEPIREHVTLYEPLRDLFIKDKTKINVLELNNVGELLEFYTQAFGLWAHGYGFNSWRNFNLPAMIEHLKSLQETFPHLLAVAEQEDAEQEAYWQAKDDDAKAYIKLCEIRDSEAESEIKNIN